MKKFYLVALNSLISGIGATLVWFAVTIWVYLETKSVVVTSILSAAYLTGIILTSIIFGSIVDHHKKRSVMMAADAISMVAFVIGFLIYIFAEPGEFQDTGSVRLWLFLAVIFMGIIVSNMRNIALPTLTGIMVDEEMRPKANGMIGAVNGVAFLISPMLGGFFIAVSGMFWVLVVALILRVMTIAHLLFTKLEEKVLAHEDEEKKKKIDLKGTLKTILGIPGLLALMIFNSFNNFLGGVFMPLIDPYGLSLVSQKVWGVISGLLSIGFILGGMFIAKFGLGKNPLRTLFLTNIILWTVCIFFTIQPSIFLFAAGILIYFMGIPFIEASEQTIIQKIVPKERQGRVFGFAQSLEMSASPLSSLAIGPITQFLFIPFMTTGAGVELIGGWFGTGDSRGIALAFTAAGLLGLILTLIGMATKYYRQLSHHYQKSHKSIKHDSRQNPVGNQGHPQA